MNQSTANPVLIRRRAKREIRGYTLAEVAISLGIIGIITAGVYGAIMSSFGMIQSTRENLRAAQVLEQTMEVIRLCNWSQVTTNNFLPTSLSVPYYTDNVSVTNNPIYDLTVTVTNPPPLGAFYSNDLRMITVLATWSSAGVNHSRTMSTYVSEWGMQNYVW